MVGINGRDKSERNREKKRGKEEKLEREERKDNEGLDMEGKKNEMKIRRNCKRGGNKREKGTDKIWKNKD